MCWSSEVMAVSPIWAQKTALVADIVPWVRVTPSQEANISEEPVRVFANLSR